MRGKYRRRKRARVEREGSATTVERTTLARVFEAHEPEIIPAPLIDDKIIKIETTIAEAQRLKRSKKKGTANLDRNMESLGYRRIAGSGMVAEQFEAIS